MMPNLPDTWKALLDTETKQDYFKQLMLDIEASYLINDPAVYPPAPLLYNAFTHCAPKELKVIILGQDPYHGPNQAMGLSFSVPDGTKIPPSLQNIYKEIANDLQQETPSDGDLTHWVNQGVLLLNSTLTVEAGAAGSHQGLGWETFTDAVIRTVSDTKTNVVFLLWGKYAESKSVLIDESNHLILTASHPSPLSAHRGFLGCKHFSQTNEYLKNHSIKEIEW
jgi:uracil-DNA glycosylase